MLQRDEKFQQNRFAAELMEFCLNNGRSTDAPLTGQHGANQTALMGRRVSIRRYVPHRPAVRYAPYVAGRDLSGLILIGRWLYAVWWRLSRQSMPCFSQVIWLVTKQLSLPTARSGCLIAWCAVLWCPAITTQWSEGRIVRYFKRSIHCHIGMC